MSNQPPGNEQWQQPPQQPYPGNQLYPQQPPQQPNTSYPANPQWPPQQPSQPLPPPQFPQEGYGQQQWQQQQPMYPPQQPMYQLPKKKSKTWLWLVAIIVVCLLACGVFAASGIFLFFQALYNSPAAKVTNSYYTAIEKQDYATAYSFLDADGITLYEHHLTQDAYVQKAKVLDVQEGKVTSYFFSNVGVEFSDGVNTANIIVNVTRKGVTYPVQVQLLQEPNDWKIISIHGI